MSPSLRDLRRFLYGACLVLGPLLAGPAHQLVHVGGHACGPVHSHCGDSEGEQAAGAPEGGEQDATLEARDVDGECALCHLGLGEAPRASHSLASLSPAIQRGWMVSEAPRAFASGRAPPVRGPPAFV
jgi:hypothetical protein